MSARTPTISRTLVLAAVLSFGSLGCSAIGPGRLDPERAALASARVRWSSQHIEHYEYSLVRLCECLPEWMRPIRIKVENDVIVSLSDAQTGAAVAAERAGLYHTVEDLFDLIADAIGRDADVVDVDYHPTLGYPVRISIDDDINVGDDEFTYVASDFAPLP